MTARAAAEGYDVAIVTGDKDFFQLVRDGVRVFNPREEGTWYDAAGVQGEVRRQARPGRRRPGADGRHHRQRQRRARHRREGRARSDLNLRHARRAARARRRGPAEEVPRSAARSRRRGPEQPELLRIHTDVPVDFDIDAFRYRGADRDACSSCSRSSGSARSSWSLRRPPTPSSKRLSARHDSRGARGAGRGAARGAAASGCACCPMGRRRFAPASSASLFDRAAHGLVRAARTCRTPAQHRDPGSCSTPTAGAGADRDGTRAGRSARGPQAAARRRRHRESRARPEVRHHRARAARRHASRAWASTRCWPAICSTPPGPAIRSRRPRSSISATRRSPKRTSAAAARRRSRLPSEPPTRP